MRSSRLDVDAGLKVWDIGTRIDMGCVRTLSTASGKNTLFNVHCAPRRLCLLRLAIAASLAYRSSSPISSRLISRTLLLPILPPLGGLPDVAPHRHLASAFAAASAVRGRSRECRAAPRHAPPPAGPAGGLCGAHLCGAGARGHHRPVRVAPVGSIGGGAQDENCCARGRPPGGVPQPRLGTGDRPGGCRRAGGGQGGRGEAGGGCRGGGRGSGGRRQPTWRPSSRPNRRRPSGSRRPERR